MRTLVRIPRETINVKRIPTSLKMNTNNNSATAAAAACSFEIAKYHKHHYTRVRSFLVQTKSWRPYGRRRTKIQIKLLGTLQCPSRCFIRLRTKFMKQTPTGFVITTLGSTYLFFITTMSISV